MKEHENYTDEQLEKFWEELSEVNIDANEAIEVDFYFFPAGTHREIIWAWFDRKHSKGVFCLMVPTTQEKEKMKITVQKLANHCDTLMDENGTLWDFEESDENSDTIEISNNFEMFAILSAQDEIEWDDEGMIHVEGRFFYTGNFVSIKPEDIPKEE